VFTPAPAPVPSNLEQQRKLAKDLVRAARAGDQEALARIHAVRSDAGAPSRPLRLADAQLAVAREAGFDSWPRLVTHLLDRDIQGFRDAVTRGDVDVTRRLLASPHVRARVNDPMFAFGQRAAHIAAKDQAMLTTLIAAGADINLKSDWENGPYTVLDCADEGAARFLLTQGATLTANAAARLGWFDELQALVGADPGLVHARGGDGQQPLHEAKTVAIADFLLDRGADIDARCIDHKSTPAQYALVDRPDVCRRLLERGATPDIFMAARLGDLDLASRLLDADSASAAARINEPGYAPVPPMHIYCWSLGFGRTPHDVALAFGHRGVYDLLVARSPAPIRFINAVLAGDEGAARAMLAEQPSLLASLSRREHGGLAAAIFHERFDAAEVMLSLGFDASAPGVDGGTALHAACWVGHVRIVEQILALGVVPVDARDPTHQSTPLGWTAFGAVHRRASGADYVAVVDRLVAAGADITGPANGRGQTLVEMARGNAAMQEALRSRGAV
jgi:ankyrin repeat protein